ncbi:hypothetical protein [Acidihalobacter ferrooxydans]|uniref:Uncharacterized protein n=1 Tax=Acidihalobacter ferrooxydans TaxID=1765967 RepID=A0A1P8UDR9_9GAMM|nr:hypothetical protein [Acidihalobacter ferrooxydans]APZ41995.1 hypothetical protein BW247_01845 [Acidihalobacter ferrooxydans]
MTDNVENLIFEHARILPESTSTQRKTPRGFGRMEVALTGLRRDMVLSEEGVVEPELRIDRLSERVERIERRLALVE